MFLSRRCIHSSSIAANGSSNVGLNDLLRTGLHIGHHRSALHQTMLPFVYGNRHDVSIINLEHTLARLRRASMVIREVAYNGGCILFLGTRPQVQLAVVKAAEMASGYWITRRWVAGTLTNAPHVLRNAISSDQNLQGLTEEQGREGRDRQRERVPKPDLLVIANLLENRIAIAEATKMVIPTIGIVDSDVDARTITYPIPGNDDSPQGVELILSTLGNAAKEGWEARKEYLERKSKF